MMRWGVLLLAATPALAQEKPPTIPLRDVDVTYRMTQPGIVQPGGARVLSQRMRWSLAAGKLRVDPPSPALYMIVDYKARRMAVVRPSERAVLDMSAAGPGLPVSPGGSFSRLGPEQVAGLACTDWQTLDTGGKAVVVCMTGDGVMLRASQDGAVLLEATSVSYATQDAAAFIPPEGFRHIKAEQ